MDALPKAMEIMRKLSLLDKEELESLIEELDKGKIKDSSFTNQVQSVLKKHLKKNEHLQKDVVTTVCHLIEK